MTLVIFRVPTESFLYSSYCILDLTTESATCLENPLSCTALTKNFFPLHMVPMRLFFNI